MPRSSAVSKPSEPSYEQALAQLEQLVQQMEQGQLPLDELLQSYQRAAGLLNLCRGRLDAVEQQVMQLEQDQLKPWTEPT